MSGNIFSFRPFSFLSQSEVLTSIRSFLINSLLISSASQDRGQSGETGDPSIVVAVRQNYIDKPEGTLKHV